MATLDSIIKQMILSAFRSAKMSSASPGWINHFIGIEAQGGMDIIGSNAEINDAIRQAVEGITSDPDSAESLAGNLLDSEQKTGKKSKGQLQQAGLTGVSTVSAIGNDPASIIARVLPSLPNLPFLKSSFTSGSTDQLYRLAGPFVAL